MHASLGRSRCIQSCIQCFTLCLHMQGGKRFLQETPHASRIEALSYLLLENDAQHKQRLQISDNVTNRVKIEKVEKINNTGSNNASRISRSTMFTSFEGPPPSPRSASTIGDVSRASGVNLTAASAAAVSVEVGTDIPRHIESSCTAVERLESSSGQAHTIGKPRTTGPLGSQHLIPLVPSHHRARKNKITAPSMNGGQTSPRRQCIRQMPARPACSSSAIGQSQYNGGAGPSY